MQNGVSQTPQAVLECRDPLDHLWRGRLRLDIGIERDFALDLLNGFGNRGFAVVYRVDDLRNDAGKRIGVRSSSVQMKCGGSIPASLT